MANKTRAFLALTLPEDARETAHGVLSELYDRLGRGSIKWVGPENLHVTLRFFGDLEAQQLQKAGRFVRALDGAFESVPTAWVGLGAFPSPRRVQVIWLGMSDQGGALRALARDVNQRLVRAGFGRADKPFAAHVTLGRVRRGERATWASISDGLTMPSGAFSMREIVLMKSRLTPAGPEYTPLEVATARNG